MISRDNKHEQIGGYIPMKTVRHTAGHSNVQQETPATQACPIVFHVNV